MNVEVIFYFLFFECVKKNIEIKYYVCIYILRTFLLLLMMQEFDFTHLEQLNLQQSKDYVKQYFVPLKNGDHAVYYDGCFKIMESAKGKATYFNRMT